MLKHYQYMTIFSMILVIFAHI